MTNKLFIAAERVARSDEFEAHLEIAKQRGLGIEIQEFYLPDLMWGDYKPRLEEYQRLLDGFQGGRAIHNAYLSIDHVGNDPEVHKLTKKRYDYIFMIAKELECTYIISHFVWKRSMRDRYLYKWQQAEARFWGEYANRAEKQGFVIVAENTNETHPEILKPIFDMVDSPSFKLNFDIAHAHLNSEVPIEDWIMAFGKNLVYSHVNNNYRNYDSHDSILSGSINYDYIFSVLNRVGIAPIITTEIYGVDNLLESIDYLEDKIRTTPVYNQQHALG